MRRPIRQAILDGRTGHGEAAARIPGARGGRGRAAIFGDEQLALLLADKAVAHDARSRERDALAAAVGRVRIGADAVGLAAGPDTQRTEALGIFLANRAAGTLVFALGRAVAELLGDIAALAEIVARAHEGRLCSAHAGGLAALDGTVVAQAHRVAVAGLGVLEVRQTDVDVRSHRVGAAELLVGTARIVAAGLEAHALPANFDTAEARRAGDGVAGLLGAVRHLAGSETVFLGADETGRHAELVQRVGAGRGLGDAPAALVFTGGHFGAGQVGTHVGAIRFLMTLCGNGAAAKEAEEQSERQSKQRLHHWVLLSSGLTKGEETLHRAINKKFVHYTVKNFYYLYCNDRIRYNLNSNDFSAEFKLHQLASISDFMLFVNPSPGAESA